MRVNWFVVKACFSSGPYAFHCVGEGGAGIEAVLQDICRTSHYTPAMDFRRRFEKMFGLPRAHGTIFQTLLESLLSSVLRYLVDVEMTLGNHFMNCGIPNIGIASGQFVPVGPVMLCAGMRVSLSQSWVIYFEFYSTQLAFTLVVPYFIISF